MSGLAELLGEIAGCRLCAGQLPHEPRPVVRVGEPSARILIVGQAPGRKVHETGLPWNDASGDRLRDWMGLSRDVFYDTRHIAIIPMGLCFPGTGRSGDLPPRPECAPAWHARLRGFLPAVELTLLVGSYAQAYYLGDRRRRTLSETVQAWPDFIGDGLLPLVHPSPRNRGWLRDRPWFEGEIVPYLRARVLALIVG